MHTPDPWSNERRGTEDFPTTGHTGEPWTTKAGFWANTGRTFIEATHNAGYKPFVAETTYSVAAYDPHNVVGGCHDAAEANARRIVACVNALAGISTENILSGAWRTQIRASEE